VRQTVAVPVPVMTMEQYGAVVSSHPRPYVLRYEPTPGALICYGSEHFYDPASPALQAIAGEFGAFKPTVVLVESRLGVYWGGQDAAVCAFGESGLVDVLARRAGLRIFTLELPLEDEVAGVLKWFSPKQTALFYILRPYFGQRRNGPPDDPDGVVGDSLRKRTRIPGLENTFTSIADIDAYWKQELPDKSDWRDCDDRYGWPGFLNGVAAKANQVRNDHWLQVAADLVRGGERVFMVCGSSHAVRLEPALKALLGR